MSEKNQPVVHAVVPSAGRGTRFLPITKSVPKEMLPVVDRPSIEYIVREATDAGIEDVLFVTARVSRPSKTTSTLSPASRPTSRRPARKRPSST